MKLFFMSDIHGSVFWLKKALKQFDHEHAEQLILLGDLLYHGPRNPPSYGILENNLLQIKDTEGAVINSLSLS